jgi:LysR family transcriptional regulator, regulator for bpeEF and oprC
MDRFEAMRAFVQVVDSGSYTRAAQQLQLHKATVSQHILQLEEHLGSQLLTRTTRSVTPTHEGLAYYQRACGILQQVDEAESALRGSTSAPAGHLRVSVSVALGRLVFAGALRDFMQRHPRVTLELGCTDRAVDLQREGVDCAVRGGELADSQLYARRLGELRFVLCAAPAYIADNGLPATPGELSSHHQVGYLPASTGKLRPIGLVREAQTAEVQVPARFTTTDSAVALSAGLEGLGLIVLAEFVASPYLVSGGLVRVLPGWQCPSLPLQFVTPSRRKRPARVLAFMDWTQALLQRRLGGHITNG